MITPARRHLIILTLAGIFLCWGCEGYVRDVASPSDLISDADFKKESGLPLQYADIANQFAAGMRFALPYSSILSDEFQNARGIARDSATEQLALLDVGSPDSTLPGSTNIDGITAFGNLRFTHRKLNDYFNREKDIQFTQESNRKRFRYIGNFFRGTLEHSLAAYYSNTFREGKVQIDTGLPVLSSSVIHDSALKHYDLAKQSATSVYETRLVNSFIARVHLLEKRYAEALQAATNGLQQGDVPFTLIFTTNLPNGWVNITPANSFIPHSRFRAYVVAEPGEAGRIPLNIGNRPIPGRTEPYYVQAKFDATTPLEMMTWQENALMLAECRLRLSNDIAGALAEVNRVRAAVPAVMGAPRLAPRTTTNLDSVYIERDKQFFGTGLRLLDQRRFNRWHFTGQAADSAWYFLRF